MRRKWPKSPLRSTRPRISRISRQIGVSTPNMGANLDLRECLACSCFAARRTARVVTQHYEQLMKPSGLRATQFTALVVLAIGGPQPLTRLADHLGVERTTLTRNLRSLLARGWVKESTTDDRRVRVLAITKSGTSAAQGALPHWREAQKSIARRLGAGAIQALAATAEATADL